MPMIQARIILEGFDGIYTNLARRDVTVPRSEEDDVKRPRQRRPSEEDLPPASSDETTIARVPSVLASTSTSTSGPSRSSVRHISILVTCRRAQWTSEHEAHEAPDARSLASGSDRTTSF